ncbi:MULTISPECIES: SCO family protein [Bacillaceae]|uniref:SCO family protein n=1 Tax=Evansella alkalicola TaxID=745819 RepID=A0ABS6JWN1_9BACI|nr:MULTISPECIES: SCO family protein [Bacillaceae]MBU9722998.1 SCO family protein [Bacillus alkalicola]
MANNKKTLISLIVVLVFGVLLFYIGTDGFRAYTAETARVIQLLEDKPKFPEVMLEDSNEEKYPISEFKGSYVFITFMYTACGTICPILEMNMGQVYRQIPEEYVGEDITFLSISFDPERDDPETLKEYMELFYADGETWRMARVNDDGELQHLLDEIGVIVIPDGEGDFAHNSAFYLVDRDGYLMDVMDFTDVDAAAERVISILEGDKGD